jgi:hypothetical protein
VRDREACGIPAPEPGAGYLSLCTPDVDELSYCFAGCVEQASCEALNGEDTAGFNAYAECVSSC